MILLNQGERPWWWLSSCKNHQVGNLIVFLAGAGQASSAWNEQVRRLPEYQSLALAATDLTEGPFSMDAAVEGLQRQILETGAESVTLIGLSLGGMIATRYAATHPEMLAGLLLSGSQIRPNPTLMSIQRGIMRLIPARMLPLPQGLDKPAFLQLLDAAGHTDLSDDLSGIEAPTLVLCGTKDRANLGAAKQLARQIPEAELRLITGGGHELATDAPDEFADAVSTLLNRQE
ncbi:alpha/beta fold hydrolase [Nesterenkonia alkaliphila]|uniref:Alpha/beta fold hydrolase n=1 Tax=Nesterenkonia alkaliphila TaxID=1463631 RepID=A0A7K1UJU6_9MICC|nr:alpha/beta fold hydrolase [Nesterenkonia alkaliphila]